MKLYHGTSATNGAHIEKYGLEPRIDREGTSLISCPDAVYLTEFQPIFFAWRDANMREKQTDLAIVEIDTDWLHPGLMAPDEDQLICFDAMQTRPDVIYGDVAQDESTLMRYRASIRERRNEWPMSLHMSGKCAYLGTVPPGALRVFYVPQSVFEAHRIDPLDPDPIYQRETLDGLIAPGKRTVEASDVFRINYPNIWKAARNRFAAGGLPLASLHGPNHWLNVHHFAEILARNGEGIDADVVRLFAMLHDVARVNEGYDTQHGPKAAKWMESIRPMLSALSGEQWEKLRYAIAHHTDGTTSEDATIGACWDCDRLDLPRVGIWPRAELLSTIAGKMYLAHGLCVRAADDYRSHVRAPLLFAPNGTALSMPYCGATDKWEYVAQIPRAQRRALAKQARTKKAA